MIGLWTGPETSLQLGEAARRIAMAPWINWPQEKNGFLNAFRTGIVLTVVGAAMLLGSPGSTAGARADGIYFGGSGFGFAIGSRGYRRGYYFGGGFSGPPFRPYGPPNYYHPYDRRAYPYRSRLYPNRSRAYVAPRIYRGQPQRVPHTKTGLPPFTPQWAAYCARKFKSFNPNTGTYLAYSGKYRFCR